MLFELTFCGILCQSVAVATCEAVVGDDLTQLVAVSGRGVVGVQRLAGRRRVTVG